MPQRITELHNIMPLANMPSVLAHGILSHERAARLATADISMPDIQKRRDKVQVPRGLRLHQYANLYFHARNPMLFKRKDQAETLCVLRISPTVLQIAGAVITDQNASSDYVKFLPPTALNLLQLDQIYAEDWRHPTDRIAYYRHKSQKCAEVLIPHQIPPQYILGAYVVSAPARQRVQQIGFSQPIAIQPYLFFR